MSSKASTRMVTGPVILRSSSTVKLVGNVMLVGDGGTKAGMCVCPPAVSVTSSWVGTNVRSPPTSTSRIESTCWQAASAATPATAPSTASRIRFWLPRRRLRGLLPRGRLRRLQRGDLRLDFRAVGRLRYPVEEPVVVVGGVLILADAPVALRAVEQHRRIVEQLEGLRVFLDRGLAVVVARQLVRPLEVSLPLRHRAAARVTAVRLALVMVVVLALLLGPGLDGAGRAEAAADRGERDRRSPQRHGGAPAPRRRT